MAHLYGPRINGVMMRIIMQHVTLIMEPVVDLMLTKLIAQNVNAFKMVQEVAVQVVQVRVPFKISRLFSPLSKNPEITF